MEQAASDFESTDPLDRAPLSFLVGPTASGKTRVALEVAERAGAEILSLDSMLVYRGMDVGTAKPTPAERARVPHHLLDLVEPSEGYSTSRYLADARRALEIVGRRGRRALFVGGTALYLKALVQGLFEGPPVDPELRSRLSERARSEGAPVLHAELAAVDPASAARIHPNDAKRVVRALETWQQSGRPLSDWQREWSPEAPGRPRTIVGLAIDVAALDERIAARTRAMLAAGWAEEARRLEDAGGLGPSATQALGYAEVRARAAGELTEEQCAERIAQRTRRFARRQRTWLRSFPEIVWVPAPATQADVPRAADAVLRALGWDGAGA